MQDIGIVQQDSTVRVMFVTRDGSGAAVAPSTAFESADVEIYKDGSATQRTSDAGVTMTSPFDTVTGLHLVAIDLSDDTDAGFWAAGSNYHVTIQPDETVDGQTVVEILAQFSIESDAERAQRLYRTYLYPESTISTVTGNTTTQINFTDIIDAQTPSDAIVGRIYSVRDATDGGIEDVVATAFTYPNATVERLSNAGAMSFTVAAGDDVWPVGFVDVEMRGRLTDTRAGYLDDLASGGANLTEVGGTGDHLTALATASALATVDTVVDGIQTDLDNGTDGLGAIKTAVDTVDTVVDAVKLKTDSLTFTVAGQVDANAKAISDDAVAADNLEADYDGTGYNKTASTLATVSTVTTLTGHTAQTGDSFARLGAPAGASVSADIANVDADIAALNDLADTDVMPAANVALTYQFSLIDSSGDPATGITVTAERIIDGATKATATGTVTEISDGVYQMAASAADMNGAAISHIFSGAGAKTRIVNILTTSAV